MSTMPKVEVQKWVLGIANNVYDLERKLELFGDPNGLGRNVARIKEYLATAGIVYEDPMGQQFKETRTDLDASISGSKTEDLYVAEVIKPIVRLSSDGFSTIVQRGIVIVESKEGMQK